MTKPTVSKHWKKSLGRQRSGLNPTKTTPLCYNNKTLGNPLCAQRKGPNVTNPICWTCKNCSHKCAADCEHCHTIQHRTVLIIFPLNLQTITITRCCLVEGRGCFRPKSELLLTSCMQTITVFVDGRCASPPVRTTECIVTCEQITQRQNSRTAHHYSPHYWATMSRLHTV